MFFNPPNILSLIRILISPVFLYFLLSSDSFHIQLACYMFIIGAITDYADGYLARKYSMETSWGGFFDPLADKILTTSAFIGFAVLHIIPWFVVFVIFIRDFSTTILRVIADKFDRPVKTSFTAKVKTFVQMVFIALVLILLYIKSFVINNDSISIITSILYSQYMFWIVMGLTFFTLWTLMEYFYQNKPVLRAVFEKK